jgi:hypothetical protein
MESHNADLSNLYTTQAATSALHTTTNASYLPLLNYSLYSNIDEQTSTTNLTNDENNPLYSTQSLNTSLDNCKKMDINHLLSQIMPITDQDLKDCEKK